MYYVHVLLLLLLCITIYIYNRKREETRREREMYSVYIERKAPSSTHTLTNRINVEFNVCILNTHACIESREIYK